MKKLEKKALKNIKGGINDDYCYQECAGVYDYCICTGQSPIVCGRQRRACLLDCQCGAGYGTFCP